MALAEFGYAYDANGNRTRLDVTGTEVTNGYELYGYDELNRLDEVRYLDGSEVAFSYDANGNLTLLSPVGGTAIAYEYDLADQLQEVDNVDLFDYDANGNRLTHGTDTFSWDWANRLVSTDVQGTEAAFTYLGDGSRAEQEIDGTTTVPYLWDRTAGLPRLLDDGTTSAVHAGGVLAEVDNATGDRAWGLLDGLGSVRARGDDAGLVTDTASWDAWGQATDAPEGTFGWTGEQTDASTGLVYLRARYYSPLYGRFLSPDPVSPNGFGTTGYNGYAYTTNNPVTLTDPSGMLPGWGGGGIGGVFAYLAYVLECYLFGECRYQRRHEGGGGSGPGEDPGSGGGGGGTGRGSNGGSGSADVVGPEDLGGDSTGIGSIVTELGAAADDVAESLPVLPLPGSAASRPIREFDGKVASSGRGGSSVITVRIGAFVLRFAGRMGIRPGQLASNQPTLRYKLTSTDLDWRGTKLTWREALSEVGHITGHPFPSTWRPVRWSSQKGKEEYVVEWRGLDGLKVHMDFPGPKYGPDVPHVGWQLRGSDRGHILLNNVPAGRDLLPKSPGFEP